MSVMEPEEILAGGALLGEGIRWDSRRQRLWWTDIHGKRLHCFDWTTRNLRALEAPDRVASFGFIAESESLVVAFAPGIARYDSEARAVAWLARPAEDMAGLRFNDGRVDCAGRFFGRKTSDRPLSGAGGWRHRGALCCLAKRAKCTVDRARAAF
jgi:L-arabinonolactonase